jgi:glutamine synthetase
VNTSQKPTFEFRVPDGSADIYLLISALAVAVREGLSNPNALQIADKFKIEGNIFREEYKDVADKLPNLPTSCVESSKKLQEQKVIYTKNNVFPSEVIDYQIKKLQAFNDENLSQKIQTTLEPEKTKIINDLVNKFINC